MKITQNVHEHAETQLEAGREVFLTGRMPKKLYTASPSTSTSGLIDAYNYSAS